MNDLPWWVVTLLFVSGWIAFEQYHLKKQIAAVGELVIKIGKPTGAFREDV